MNSATPPPEGQGRRRNFGILGLVLGLVLIVMVLLFTLFFTAIFFLMSEEELEPSESDLARLLGLEDLQAVGYPFTVEPGECTTKMVESFDGSTEITYECEPADNSFYLESTVYYEPDTNDVLLGYKATRLGLKLGLLAEEDVEVVPAATRLEWGDESTFEVMTVEGSPSGFLFLARRGNHHLMYVVSGVDATELTPEATANTDRLAAGF